MGMVSPQAVPTPAASPRAERMIGPQVCLFGIVLLALLLRTWSLGGVFESSDNCELAAKVVRERGYAWMASENYGILISLIVKLAAATVSSLGITLTEFWWKLPISVFGAMQAPLTFALLRTMGARPWASVAGAGAMAVLPVHVGQSRYLWGYEMLGLFFLTLALLALIAFFRDPVPLRGLAASAAVAGYLVSHGYILPLIPSLALVVWFLAERPAARPAGRFLHGCLLLLRRGVWVLPLLTTPLLIQPLRHALRKPTRLGFYAFDHLEGFLGNTGMFLGVLVAAGAVLALTHRAARSHEAELLSLSGGFYLAPLFFGAPPGITVVRGYMLVGTGLWVCCLAVVLDRLALRRPGRVAALAAACLAVTAWSAVETVLLCDGGFDPNGAIVERGEVAPDPGVKAAGCLMQDLLAPGARVLAIHRAVEPPHLTYYFRFDPDDANKKAFYDLPIEAPVRVGSLGHPCDTRQAFERFGPGAHIVLCEEAQVPWVRDSGQFEERITLCWHGQPRMWVFARRGVPLPARPDADIEDLNRAFDRKYAWKVHIW